ncbi:MAG TPA: 50S ribosomal protein L6 [Elusimicrobia bacterium]|nr:50S ribosomal protein L6 [Elusimicrobiota bacterium]
MSRVGKQPIPVPEKVDVAFNGNQVRVKGPLGELSWEMPAAVKAEKKDGKIFLTADISDMGVRALYGTARARVANMVQGVSQGYQTIVEIVGLGFKAEPEGQRLMLSLGFSHKKAFDVPKDVKVEVDKKQTTLVLKSHDKELLGATVARLKAVKPTEPYKGTGIRRKGDRIIKKAGKTAAGATAGAAGAAKK